MANVILSFDAGVSLSKCIYEIVETGERRVLLMRPQVMTVPLSTIEGYRKMKLGSPRPEAEAWGVVVAACKHKRSGLQTRHFLAQIKGLPRF